MKIDLSKLDAIPTAIAGYRQQRAAIDVEVAELDAEKARLARAPLSRQHMLEIIEQQVDRAGAWWLKTAAPQFDQIRFDASGSSIGGRSKMVSLGDYTGEPFVAGLFRGASAMCYFFRDELLAGYARALAERDFSSAGLPNVERLRAIAEIDDRIKELEEHAAQIDSELGAIVAIDERLDNRGKRSLFSAVVGAFR